MKQTQQLPSKMVPERLKLLRERRGWSQGQIAKKVGADPQRISKYERGVICPTADMIVKLANAFEVSLDYFLRGEEEVDMDHIQNRELLKRFEKVGSLPEEEQKTLMTVMDAFLQRQRLHEVVGGDF